MINITPNLGYDDAVCPVSLTNPKIMLTSSQYISWVADGKMSWTINAAGLGPDPTVEISARPVPQEPMVVLLFTSAASTLLMLI